MGGSYDSDTLCHSCTFHMYTFPYLHIRVFAPFTLLPSQQLITRCLSLSKDTSRWSLSANTELLSGRF